MTANQVTSALVFVAALGCLSGCAGGQGTATPAASQHFALAASADAETLIPVDLDLLVRVDVQRFRSALPSSLLRNLFLALPWLSQRGDDTALVKALIEKTDLIVLGLSFRSINSGGYAAADYVAVFEGTYADAERALLFDAFHPPRDLGGGILRYDAQEDTQRSAPGRVYEQLGERFLVASTAEVDALERVVEGGRYERSVKPDARGIFSIKGSSRTLALGISPHSARSAEFFERARTISGALDVSETHLSIELELQFDESAQANRAQQALNWVILYLSQVAQVDIQGTSVQRTDSRLTISHAVELATAAAWLGLL